MEPWVCCMCCLHFEKKSYGKVVISQLAHMYFDMGEDVYIPTEENNQLSVKLHESLGFRIAPDVLLTSCTLDVLLTATEISLRWGRCAR